MGGGVILCHGKEVLGGYGDDVCGVVYYACVIPLKGMWHGGCIVLLICWVAPLGALVAEKLAGPTLSFALFSLLLCLSEPK